MADERTRQAAAARGMPLDGLRAAGEPASPGERVALGQGGLALRTGDHAAIIYWEPEELLRSVVPYLVEGLKAGDRVVYVADDLSLAELERALGEAGVEVAAESRAGRLVLTTAAAAFFPQGRFDLEGALAGVNALAQGALQDGYRRVRFSVEMTYLLAQVPGIERGPEFESRANEEVFARLPFVCICSFNAARDVSDTLSDVLRTHPVLIEQGVPMANPYYRAWSDFQNDPAAVARWASRALGAPAKAG